MKKTKCDAVKLEEFKDNFQIIKILVEKNTCNGSYWVHSTI